MAISTVEEGRFLVINETFFHKTGYSREEIIGKTSKELNIFTQYGDGAAIIEKLRSGEPAVNIRSDVRTKSGSVLKGFFSADIIEFEGKRHLLTIFNDMTETIDALNALSQAEEQWKTTFDGTNDGICLLAPDQTILRCNRTLCELIGKTPGQIIGHRCFEVIHGESNVLPECPINRMRESLRRETMEMHLGDLWLEVSVDPVLGRNKEITGIVHIVRDITEKKTAEEKLLASEEKYRTLAESSPDMIYLIDTEGFVQYVNQAGLAMFGGSSRAVIGKHLRDLFPHTIAERHINVIKGIFSTGRSFKSELLEEFPKGKRWIEARLSPIRDSKGAIVAVLGLSQDITARKRAEEELQRAEKLESLKVLAGGIAHDFNNLLGGIFGYLDLARTELPKDHPAYEYLNKSLSAFERARHLAHQMLTFARGGAPVKKTLRLPDILTESCSLALSGSNIRCEYRISDGLWLIEGDENQLSQVFNNIVINAWQAMPDGGTVTVSAENRMLEAGEAGNLPAGRYVVVAVRDEGVGIPEKIIDKIFDPFFTTKQRGSGLGLATCHSIITRHSGHISVASKPGEGSVFTVFLPASELSASIETGKVTDADLRGTGRILIMDDEKVIREMARDILSKHGYEVVVTADGKEAVDAYVRALEEKQGFDLVILDLTVPGGMGGEKTLSELKKIDPQVAAIVSSGYCDNTVLADFATHGFSGMVAKPYRADELLLTVKKTMRKGNSK